MYHRLYIHATWTTADRARTIDLARGRALSRILRGLARKDGATVLEVGLVATHVHVLARISPTVSVSKLLQRLKGASAHLLNEQQIGDGDPLRWARGYSAHSVGERHLEAVHHYLRNQPRHHPEDAIPGWSDRY